MIPLGGPRRRALIDLAAFADNVRAVAPTILDLRADAYGHDLSLLAPVAIASGAEHALVSDEDGARRAEAAGFATTRIDRAAPIDPATQAVFGLGSGAPVMTLCAELLAVKRAQAGAGVSYGYTHRTTAPTLLGLAGLGYADGVPRLASNRAEVAVAGARRPLVGRIAMDQFVLDLVDMDARPGDELVLFGPPSTGAPSVLEWAAWTERAPLALTAGLGARIERRAA